MTGMESLGTVYFERAINGEIFLKILCDTNSFLIFYVDTHSELYFVRDVADIFQQPQVFDPGLGSFKRNSFVLELEYMFVQVRNT